jgi:hypothetical protein
LPCLLQHPSSRLHQLQINPARCLCAGGTHTCTTRTHAQCAPLARGQRHA